MIKYKKLISLFKNNGLKIMSLNDLFVRKRIYSHTKERVINFELSDKAEHEAALLLANAICETKKSCEKYCDLIVRYSGSRHYIFERLWIEYRDENLRSTYCAGQDYPAEIRYVQKLIREGA